MLFLPKLVFAQTDWSTVLSDLPEVSETDLPSSAIVIDAQNGQILWSDEPDQANDPASLTTLMTLFLALEKIQSGEISLTDTVTATAEDEMIAQLQTMKNNNVITGNVYSIEELIQLILTPTSNVATLMLGQQIEEDPDAFVDLMNTKAQELGLTNTKYWNATGIPASYFGETYVLQNHDPTKYNQATASDLAILTYHLLKEFPEILDWSKQTETTVLSNTLYEENFSTNNLALAGQSHELTGLDGLLLFENGSTANYVATAKRNGMRIITIFLNAVDNDSLFLLNNALMERMFETYEYKEILAAGKQKINRQNVNVASDFYGVVAKDVTPTFELSNDMITLSNSLPLVSETLEPLAVTYTDARSTAEKNIENNHFVMWLLETIEITKTTIFALGAILLGLLLLLMSLFIPRHFETPKPQLQVDDTMTRRQQQKKNKPISPYKWIVCYSGLAVLLIGMGTLLITHFI